MSGLARRVPTAIAYGAVVIGAVAAPPIVFTVLLLIAGTVSLLELIGLRRAGWVAVAEGALVLVGLMSLWALRMIELPLSFVAGWIVPESARLAAPLGWPYTIPVPYVLIMVLAATWAADVFAYLGGTLVGRHKIAPRISPGKTWEGTIIGFIAATVVFLLLHRWLGYWYGGVLAYVAPIALIVALGIGPVALAGDLLESWVKRRAGVKDSGTLLPGHGGVLDRIDSLVATATFAVLPLLVPCCAPSGMMIQ